MEDEGASLGGVLYDHLGNPLSFSQKLDDSVVSSSRETSDHPIYEIELLGAWMGMKISQMRTPYLTSTTRPPRGPLSRFRLPPSQEV